jgi:REP element-mobilizing transposase RayT
MPKRSVEFFPDGIYHLYNRGIDGRVIFLNDRNYLLFTEIIIEYSSQLSIDVLAYCLMPTHYHLLVRQNGDRSAGLLCQKICNSYSKAFNIWNHRTGALFESRFKSIVVDKDEYLLQLFRYIHANPVKAGLVDSPDKWRYSDFNIWMSFDYHFGDPSTIKNMFMSSADYKSFVLDYINDTITLPDGFYRYAIDE